MWPDELFWDSIFRNWSKFIKEGSFFEVYIQTVTKADFCFAHESILVNSERKVDFTSTLFEARECSASYLLCKP